MVGRTLTQQAQAQHNINISVVDKTIDNTEFSCIITYNNQSHRRENTMSIRTRFEIETFMLGSHSTMERKAQALKIELEQAQAQNHPDLPVIQAIYDDFSKENNVDELIANIESTEEQYWVDRLARLAAIDILTIGKVQPEHMQYMASLNDEAFEASVKGAVVLAKSLNESVREIEAELGSDLLDD